MLRKGSFGPHVFVLPFDRSDPRRLCAGAASRGVFRSPTDISAGMTTTWIAALALDPLRPSKEASPDEEIDELERAAAAA